MLSKKQTDRVQHDHQIRNLLGFETYVHDREDLTDLAKRFATTVITILDTTQQVSKDPQLS